MRLLGEVSHVTKRGLVLRVPEAPKESTLVYDGAKKRVGSIIDIFGPTSMPYICIRPAMGVKDDIASLVGKELYIMEEGERGESRKRTEMPRMWKRQARARL